jgi:hypothetical protein
MSRAIIDRLQRRSRSVASANIWFFSTVITAPLPFGSLRQQMLPSRLTGLRFDKVTE